MQEKNAKKLQLFQKSVFILEKAKNSMPSLTLSLFIILYFVAAATELDRTF